MKEENRTLKSSKNALFAIICQIITLILSFITRSIFIKLLSETYLGLNGVFSNIISFLCLAELGVGNVLLYNLYKPLKDDDFNKICQILNLFKKIYTFIAITIFVLGIGCIPFLKYILNGVELNLEAIIIYLLFLTNTILSYVYAYKISLLTANQKNYIVSKVTIITTILKEGFQIFILFIFKNYVLFIIITIITTLLKNILLNIKANKLYPQLKHNVDELSKSEQKKIFTDFKDIFLYKVSGVVLNSTDNILISVLVKSGTIMVGIYSNYLLITESLNKLIGAGFQALTASIGNLNSGEETAKKYMVFKTLNFMAYWIYGVCFICFMLLVNPFINIFAGEKYLFNFSIVLIISISFYVDGTFTPIWIFRETTGSFKTSKYAAIIQATINIVLSIILGKLYGVAGILGATIISRLTTTYWYEPRVIIRNYLTEKYFKFWIKHIVFLLKTLITIFIIYFVFKNIIITNYLEFLLYGASMFMLANVLFVILHFKDEEFKYIINKIKLIVRRNKNA